MSSESEEDKKLTKEEMKMMKDLESGKYVEEKIKEEPMLIQGNKALEWYMTEHYDIAPDVGLIWKNYPIISKQRTAIFSLIKQIGANVLSGKSVMSISLPITIMEPLTLLQRTAQTFLYLPSFAEKLRVEDPIEKLKNFIAYFISSLHLSLNQYKPLNPIWGETYQGYLGSIEYPVYCEQVSHHPPMWCVTVDSSVMTIYMLKYVIASTYPNSAYVKTKDHYKIVFKDSQHTTYKVTKCPDVAIKGLMFGRRTVSCQKELVIKDKTNKLYAQMRFDPEKQGFFEKVFKKTEPHRSDFFKGFITKNKALLKDMSRKAFYSKEIIAYCEGNWLENIKIDGDSYWNMGDVDIPKLINEEKCLESDSSKRKDSCALAAGDEDKAQKFKEELEDIQRNDRKLRAEAAKKAKK